MCKLCVGEAHVGVFCLVMRVVNFVECALQWFFFGCVGGSVVL